jgi:hypothetical protein
MLRLSVLALCMVVLASGSRQPAQLSNLPSAHDTVQAGDAVVDATLLRPFALVRRLTMTRGDTVKPFGRQSEQLTIDTLDGQPVLLDVLRFETPNGTTVDSSWAEPHTLRPLRMRSRNKARVVSLEFDGGSIRGRTAPSTGTPTDLNEQLDVRPFEWNLFGLAVSALPLRPGYRATMPVYVARFSRIVWYSVGVVRDTSLLRPNGLRAPVWEVLATGDSVVPSARFWVSQRHRLVDRVLLSEPGISIMYAREPASHP